MNFFSRCSALEKASLALAVALLACLLPMPYGFYTLVRLAAAIIAACWAARFYAERKAPLAVTAAAVAVLFQPIVKITLDRLTWNVVDVALAAAITFIVIKNHRRIEKQ